MAPNSSLLWLQPSFGKYLLSVCASVRVPCEARGQSWAPLHPNLAGLRGSWSGPHAWTPSTFPSKPSPQPYSLFFFFFFFEAQKDSKLNFSQFFCFEKEVFSVKYSFILQMDGLLKNCNLG